MIDSYWSVANKNRVSYSGYANHYVESTKSFERYPGLYQELCDFLEVVAPGPVLDVGAGSGRDAQVSLSRGCMTVIADSSIGMLTNSIADVAASRVACDVLQLPFAHGAFRGVIASGVLLHVPKSFCSAALGELSRVLAGNGCAAISMRAGEGERWVETRDFPAPRWFSFYEPNEFIAICEGVGLRTDELKLGSRDNWFTLWASKSLSDADGSL